jgi:hypothetical protein
MSSKNKSQKKTQKNQEIIFASTIAKTGHHSQKKHTQPPNDSGQLPRAIIYPQHQKNANPTHPYGQSMTLSSKNKSQKKHKKHKMQKCIHNRQN